ncbi:hypothetical protein PV10_06914 [Exophiala mesophila]|uniref:Uncharacterized protein n=1 Tax=Exophiala mesophila TaxID=212818 RepID=A0A0D1XN37_EXOME|nr:uncharacterized protein PV10_06914 [Exophiala mesophila]KIV89521.1 hypothetical protein PV10_06914 [Exophiala mesophila]
MDPISSTLGIAAGVASIITIIGKSVCTLNTLRLKYKDAAFNINLLTNRLSIVKTALVQVDHFVNENLEHEPQHLQLTLDLDESLKCCGTLVEHIHDQIAKFEWDDELLRLGRRALFLLEDQTIKDLMMHLDHHINALNLCLIAFNCRTPNEQKRFLNREESRRVFKLARDDTTSLIEFRDSISFGTSARRSSIGSQFSKTFEFDGFLLRHKIYQNTFRSMLRRVASPTENLALNIKSRTMSETPPISPQSDSKTSALIDSQLKEDGRKMKREIKMLAMGDRHGRSAVVRQMRIKFGQPFTDAEIEQHRQSITLLTIQALIAIVDYVQHSTGFISHLIKAHAQIVRDFVVQGAPDWTVSPEVATSIMQIWQNWHVKQAYRIMQQHGPTAYFLRAIERVCHPDYFPSNMDIIRAPETIDTVKETELTIDKATVRVVEIKDQNAMRIMPQFADVHFCVFSIDLTCYNRYLDDEDSTNELFERLQYLRAIFRSKFFHSTVVLIVFTNSLAFAKQIAESPLKSHFGDYSGGNNVDAAMKYIIGRCKLMNQLDRPFFWHCYDFAARQGDGELMADFFRRSASIVGTMKRLREIGLGPKSDWR